MEYVKLYFIFMKIGVLSFGGGYATLPLIQKYIIEKNQWLDMNTMLDLISISQMTPGPIAINSASFVGNKIGGIFGSIIATIGVIIPQIVLLTIFLILTFKEINKYLIGINAAVVALILISSIKLIKVSLLSTNNYIMYILFILIFILSYRKVNIINLIILGGLIGLLNHLVLFKI